MNTTPDSANAATAALPLAPGSGPTAEDIDVARRFVAKHKAKLRAGYKMTIDTKTMRTRSWPTIEVWDKAKRQYFPLKIGETWRWDKAEDRDAVLAAILSPNNVICEPHENPRKP